jgi:L-fuconolactonase
MYIDGHFHIWSLARGDYGWLTPAFDVLYRDYGLAHWRDEFAPLGVTAGILVQAASTEEETAFLLEHALAYPHEVAGVVGWTDFERDDAPARIAALATDPHLVGLRPMLQDLPDPDWIGRPFAHRALAAMAESKLTFDALVRPVHLPWILELVERHPSLTVVIDHAAKPDIASGVECETWRERLAALAAHPSVYCKLSGLWTEAAPGSPIAAVEPWARCVLELFGTERTIWGSDFPVVRCAGAGRAWLAYALDLVRAYGPDALPRVFGANARRAYRLADGSAADTRAS